MKTLSLRSNSILSILDQGLNLGSNLIIVILFANYFGAAQLGHYSLAVTLVGVVSVFTNFGVNIPFARKVAVNEKKLKYYIKHIIIIRFLVSLPLLLVLSYALTIYLNYSVEVFYLCGLAAAYNFLLAMNTTNGLAFTSLHRNDLLLIFNACCKSTMLVSSVLIVLYGGDIYTVVFVNVVIALSFFIYSLNELLSFTENRKIKFNFTFCKILVLGSFPLILAAAAEFISLRVNTLFIGALMSEKEVGLYTVSYNVYIGLCLLPLAVTRVFFANFVKIFMDSLEDANKLFKKFFKIFLVYSIVAGFLLFLLSHYIIIWFFGAEFEESIKILQWLGAALFALVLNRLVNSSLLALGLNNFYLKISVLGVSVNVILNYFLIIKFGLLGAVVATFITEFIVMTLGLWGLKQKGVGVV